MKPTGRRVLARVAITIGIVALPILSGTAAQAHYHCWPYGEPTSIYVLPRVGVTLCP